MFNKSSLTTEQRNYKYILGQELNNKKNMHGTIQLEKIVINNKNILKNDNFNFGIIKQKNS